MSEKPDFEAIKEGDSIPDLVADPISKEQLRAFADASGDDNPIHLDEAQAKEVGLPGVIAHGMLNMAVLGRLLTSWVPQQCLRDFSARFTAMAFPGDTITCKGTVTGKREEGGHKLVDLDIVAENQDGKAVVTGKATVALD